MGEGSAPPIGQISSVVLKRVTEDDLALPALPWVLRAAAEALSESPFAPHKVATALEPDPLCVARLIRKANSAAYSAGAAVCTPQDAVARLGPRSARIFLDDSGVDRPILSRNADINANRQRVWEHCVAVALVAQDLAGFVFGLGHGEVTKAAYTGGLLHDLGKPVVAALLLDSERRLAGAGVDRWLDAGDWGKVVMGSHATVGRLLAVKWGMPTIIRHCIAEPYAYDPWKPYAVSNFVTLANAVVERIGLDVGTPLDPVAMEMALSEGPKLLGFPEANIAWASRDLDARVAAHMGAWNLSSAVLA
ncbi:MAG: HDOD domain-containing protein [Deltaproteobacteria bacterium]|nr:HDOD domain-containing protein [Deltaproteobacteria bacterium]